MLNLLGKGDILKEYFEEIVNLCRIYSRGSSETKILDKGLEQDVFTRTHKSSSGGATQEEIGNLLEKFKIEMMSSLSSELDILREKKRKVVEDLTLSVFYPRCKKKHPLKECPLYKGEYAKSLN